MHLLCAWIEVEESKKGRNSDAWKGTSTLSKETTLSVVHVFSLRFIEESHSIVEEVLVLLHGFALQTHKNDLHVHAYLRQMSSMQNKSLLNWQIGD